MLHLLVFTRQATDTTCKHTSPHCTYRFSRGGRPRIRQFLVLAGVTNTRVACRFSRDKFPHQYNHGGDTYQGGCDGNIETEVPRQCFNVCGGTCPEDCFFLATIASNACSVPWFSRREQ